MKKPINFEKALLNMSKSSKSTIDSNNKFSYVVILIDENSPYLNIVAKDEPHCLLNLVNVPIIHYLMIQLLNANFRNFTIFCSNSHKRKLKKLFKLVTYDNFVNDKLKISFIGGDFKTPSDAMKYLESINFDKDFLLINGDVVSDVDYTKAVKEFENKRNKDSNVIIAQILSNKLPDELKMCSKTTDFIQIDNESRTIVSIKSSEESLSKLPNSSVLKDLYDTEIFICSNNIPPMFTENHDVSNMDDLTDYILAHAELVPNKVQVITVDDVCCRVRDLNTYSYMSMRLMRSQLKNLSPSSIFQDNVRLVSATGEMLTNHTACYISTMLPRDYTSSSTKYIGNVRVEAGSRIGDNCRLDNCVVGYNCTVGNNVTLRNCWLLSDVTVGNNCTVVDSFLCANSSVGNSCQLTGKCVVDYGYEVAADTRCEGRVLSDGRVDPFWNATIGSGRQVESDDDYEEGDGDGEVDHSALFRTQLQSLLKAAIKNGMSLENVRLETSRLKHDHELNAVDVCCQLVNGFVELCLADGADAGYRVRLTELLEQYRGLINHFTDGDEDRRMSCLEAVEEAACYSDQVMDRALDIFYSLYETEIVTESDIEQWYDESALLVDAELADKTADIRTRLAKMMTYLEEAEEESD